MFIKFKSNTSISKALILQNHHHLENEVHEYLKSFGLIFFSCVMSSVLLFSYQLIHLQPIHQNVSECVWETALMVEEIQSTSEYLPSTLNLNEVEMGPFLVPIISCESANLNAHTNAFSSSNMEVIAMKDDDRELGTLK